MGANSLTQQGVRLCDVGVKAFLHSQCSVAAPTAPVGCSCCCIIVFLLRAVLPCRMCSVMVFQHCIDFRDCM